jgi:hypothetical protein
MQAGLDDVKPLEKKRMLQSRVAGSKARLLDPSGFLSQSLLVLNLFLYSFLQMDVRS